MFGIYNNIVTSKTSYWKGLKIVKKEKKKSFYKTESTDSMIDPQK